MSTPKLATADAVSGCWLLNTLWLQSYRHCAPPFLPPPLPQRHAHAPLSALTSCCTQLLHYPPPQNSSPIYGTHRLLPQSRVLRQRRQCRVRGPSSHQHQWGRAGRHHSQSLLGAQRSTARHSMGQGTGQTRGIEIRNAWHTQRLAVGLSGGGGGGGGSVSPPCAAILAVMLPTAGTNQHCAVPRCAGACMCRVGPSGSSQQQVCRRP